MQSAYVGGNGSAVFHGAAVDSGGAFASMATLNASFTVLPAAPDFVITYSPGNAVPYGAPVNISIALVNYAWQSQFLDYDDCSQAMLSLVIGDYVIANVGMDNVANIVVPVNLTAIANVNIPLVPQIVYVNALVNTTIVSNYTVRACFQ